MDATFKHSLNTEDIFYLNDDLEQHIQLVKNITVNTIQYDGWLYLLLIKIENMFDNNIDIDDKLLWVDCHIYWLYLAPQRSEKWLKVRKGRVTGSVAGYACNESEYDTNYNKTAEFSEEKGYTLDDVIKMCMDDIDYDQILKNEVDLDNTAKEINGEKQKQFSNFAINCMKHGNLTEDKIREWHEKRIQGKVLELPLAVPKWCIYLGVSIDGYIFGGTGIAEYKAPQKMYLKLVQHIQKQQIFQQQFKNSKPKTTFNHININHLIQMMVGMKVFQKDFCDYVVYDNLKDNQVFCQKIEWQNEYWDNKIWPNLKYFIDNNLKPIIPAGYPLIPNQ